ncbi:uncharacterized protein TNCT_152651 [Trichonephila clavata]|uniref:Uncharacterized protein n=1 Tax=Trichonephila clavata TaxID=2740835 RepID=A0A8X6FGR7_TRICU|nr:uncharacterized protein TNCT_152651 [Trichonephila clavata]
MPYAFPQWESARRLNEQIKMTPHTCQYVLLLNKTNCFDIEKDLRNFLKINHKPLVWFINTFQKHRVRVEYAVLFAQRELSVFGPIANQQTHDILSKRFENIYGEFKQIFVSLPRCLKKLWGGRKPFPTVSIETFRDQHRWKVLQQVAEWLHIPNAISMH